MQPIWFDRDNTISSEEADSPMRSTWIDRSIASREIDTESPKRSTWADRDNTDSRKETDSLMRSTWTDNNNVSSKMDIESSKRSTWIDRNTTGRKTYTESPKQSAWTSRDNTRNRIDTEPSNQSTWIDRNSTSSKMDAESIRRSVRTPDEKEDSSKFPKADLLSWATVGSPLLSTLPKTTAVDESISPLLSRSIDSPPTAPIHLDQDFNDKTLSDIKHLQAQDSTRQVVESSLASQRRLPSQAPPQVDRSVYRTILDWSVHPTVQPDDFNVLSEAQRTMVRIKRLASVKGSLSSSSSSALPSSTTVGSSNVFQWPYSSKSDARSDRVSIKDLNSDLSKRSFKFDPIQERYSERRFWMGNSNIDSNSESNSRNEDLATDTKPRRSRARIGFDSLDEQIPTKASELRFEEPIKEPQNVKEEEDRVNPSTSAIKKITNNQFLYSPRVVFPAIKSRIRTLCKLYYSEESVMMSRVWDPEYE
ncbi:hypothetical protein BGX20_004850 [Mortierella sp. AD010]|nr:hypothetical protein BGX20_004850 [Mortierella sp. AD010]